MINYNKIHDVEINYVCADFIGDSITKITSNKGRGPKAQILYLEGIFCD